MQNINFDAFDNTKQELKKFKRQHKQIAVNKLTHPIVGWVVINIFLFFPFLIFLVLFGQLQVAGYDIGFIFICTFSTIANILLLYGMFNGYYNTIRIAKFASDNSWEYSAEGGGFLNKQNLRSVLGNQNISGKVSGTIGGSDFIFGQTYGIRGFFWMMQIKLPNSYPHILLDAKSNNYYISNVLKKSGDQKPTLVEYQFESNYNVWSTAPPAETLQILSPELLHKIIDHGLELDVEIVDNKLHLIGNKGRVNQKFMAAFFKTASEITKDLAGSSNNAKVKFANTTDRLI
ncbi:MAG: hypothetical protein ACK5MR_16365 [Cumulibacter sp.]